MSSRGHRVFVFTLWMCVGVSINVIVASVILNYGLRTARPDPFSPVTTMPGDWTLAAPSWPAPQRSRLDRWWWGDRLLLSWNPDPTLLRQISEGFISDEQEQFADRRVDRYRVGLPLATASCWYIQTSSPKPFGTYGWNSVLFTSLPGAGDIVIPLRPIWAGLLVNSFVFGFGLWTLSRIPGVLRRRQRRRNGRCQNCGYDRIGLTRQSPCPECGQSFPASH